MFYIAGTRVGIERLNIFAEQLVDYFNNLIDSNGPAAGDIKDLAGGVFGLCGKEICFDDIIDIGKITALLAIAKNSRFFILQDSVYKGRFCRCLLACGVLMRAENIKIAERNSFKAIDFVKNFSVIFADDFCGCVRRKRAWWHRFDFGQRRGIAVSG